MLATGAACAQAPSTLPEVSVEATRHADTDLGLKNKATSGATVDISTQDLPASLSSVSSEQSQERGDFAVTNAVTRTVGLSVNSQPGNGGLSFSSRGFTGVNSVGVAEDGQTLGVAAGTLNYPNSIWGYERFDVLRGPGSLMYGSGTMGATINAVRKAPSSERSSDVLIGAGSHGQVRLGVGTTGAISDTLTYRIDAYGERTDGERALDNPQSQKLMTSLRWQPASNLRFDLTADISDNKASRYFGTPVENGRIVRSLGKYNYNVSDSDVHYEDKRLRAKAEWKINDLLTLHNELYHFKADRHWRNIEAYSYDSTSSTVARDDYLEIGHKLQQTGNRLRVSLSPGDHKISAGWDTSEAKFRTSSNSPYGTPTTVVDAVNPDHGYWTSPDPYLARSATQLKQNAFYLEDAWSINAKWIVMAGMRRDFYDFNRTDLLSNAKAGVDLAGTSWRLGLTHRITPLANVYAQVSRGHDPVGSLLSLSATQTTYRLTQGRQAEIGWKQQLPNEQGEFTVAAFDIDKKNIITRDPQRPALSIQGGQQSSRGVEVSGAYQVSKGLRFDGNVAYVRAKFDELLEGSTGINRAGNRPTNVPRVTANLWGHYRSGAWQTSLGMRHVGDQYGDNANTNTSKLPSYTVADLVVRWDVNPKTSVNLAVRNLTDRVYASSAYSSEQWLLAPGRSFELTSQFRF